MIKRGCDQSVTNPIIRTKTRHSRRVYQPTRAITIIIIIIITIINVLLQTLRSKNTIKSVPLNICNIVFQHYILCKMIYLMMAINCGIIERKGIHLFNYIQFIRELCWRNL
jgi:glucan phosphoethanolaminetransferase (alkaline phosphatase superfamily)